MSALVKRCRGTICGGRVLGLSSFRVIRKSDGGGRSDVCKFCESEGRQDEIRMHARQAMLAQQISALRKRIGELEKERLKLRVELGYEPRRRRAS